MKKLSFVVSLPNANDYQREQAKAAAETAERLSADLRVLEADNDAVVQSQQLLEVVQSKIARPDAILFEPLTATALARVAEAAVAAGIAWVVLNCDVVFSRAPEPLECSRFLGNPRSHRYRTYSGQTVCRPPPRRGSGSLHSGSGYKFRSGAAHQWHGEHQVTKHQGENPAQPMDGAGRKRGGDRVAAPFDFTPQYH